MSRAKGMEHISDPVGRVVDRVTESRKANGKLHATEHIVQSQAEAARNLLLNLADLIDGDDEFAAHVVEAETSLTEAIEMAIREMRDCDVISGGCAMEIETLQSRKRRADDRKEKLRASIEQALMIADVKTLPTATKTLTLVQRKGGPVIDNEADIPSRFFRPQPPKLDREALAEAMGEGPVPGAHMSNGSVSLAIRSK